MKPLIPMLQRYGFSNIYNHTGKYSDSSGPPLPLPRYPGDGRLRQQITGSDTGKRIFFVPLAVLGACGCAATICKPTIQEMFNQFLTVVWHFNPTFIRIGSLDIRWYGVMWAIAIGLGAFFFVQFCKREGLPAKLADSIFIYGALATIIGARLGHCLFYEPGYYLANPLKLAGLPRRRHGEPRSGHRTPYRSVALFAEEQDALPVVAGSGDDSRGRRRCFRPDG